MEGEDRRCDAEGDGVGDRVVLLLRSGSSARVMRATRPSSPCRRHDGDAGSPIAARSKSPSLALMMRVEASGQVSGGQHVGRSARARLFRFAIPVRRRRRRRRARRAASRPAPHRLRESASARRSSPPMCAGLRRSRRCLRTFARAASQAHCFPARTRSPLASRCSLGLERQHHVGARAEADQAVASSPRRSTLPTCG